MFVWSPPGTPANYNRCSRIIGVLSTIKPASNNATANKEVYWYYSINTGFNRSEWKIAGSTTNHNSSTWELWCNGDSQKSAKPKRSNSIIYDTAEAIGGVGMAAENSFLLVYY